MQASPENPYMAEAGPEFSFIYFLSTRAVGLKVCTAMLSTKVN